MLKDGFVVVRNAFDPVRYSEITSEIERVHENFDTLKQGNPKLVRLGEWSVQSPHLVSKPIERFIFSDHYERICREQLGDDCDFYWTTTAAKPPGRGKAFPWHQDAGYGEKYGYGPTDYITCWAAFDEVDEENGCLWVVPGSHKPGVLPHEYRKQNDQDYAGVFLREANVDEREAIPLRLSPGDIACLSSKVIHCTRRNLTSRKRRGLIQAFVRAGSYRPEEITQVESPVPFLRSGRIQA